MKILAIGDFHGKFPQKLVRLAGRKDVDLIVTQGDFCGNAELGRLFFKYAYGTDRELREFIGLKKVRELDRKNFLAGLKVIRKLNSLDKKVIGVRGNWDPVDWRDIGFASKKDPYRRRFDYVLGRVKNIKIIDFSSCRQLGLNFVGYPRSTYPGKITKHIEEKIKKRDEKSAFKIIRKIKKDNKELFKKFKKRFTSNTIFISHNCLYNTKLDKIKKGIQKGKHYGSFLARKITCELKPKLVICGHMHENQGKCKIGNSLVVNPGAAADGKAAIIEFDEKTKKVTNVKFIR